MDIGGREKGPLLGGLWRQARILQRTTLEEIVRQKDGNQITYTQIMMGSTRHRIVLV